MDNGRDHDHRDEEQEQLLHKSAVGDEAIMPTAADAASVPLQTVTCGFWGRDYREATPRCRGMKFGEWLAMTMPAEDQLKVELDARKEDPRTAMLYRLCCQQQYQLQKAVNEIARLELMLMDLSR